MDYCIVNTIYRKLSGLAKTTFINVTRGNAFDGWRCGAAPRRVDGRRDLGAAAARSPFPGRAFARRTFI